MKKDGGFTTVELLVTLFIAAAFLMSGYQLYSMIIRDGGEARARAKASNVAYEYLQKEKAVINDTKPSECDDGQLRTEFIYSQANNNTIEVDSLSNVEIKINNQCAYDKAVNDTIIRTTVPIKYNTPQQSLTEATYYAVP